VTGNSGSRFTAENYSDGFLAGRKISKIYSDLGIIGIIRSWQINERLDFVVLSDLFAKAVFFLDQEKIMEAEMLLPYDLTFSGYFNYRIGKDVTYNFGLATTHKFGTDICSFRKMFFMADRLYRDPEDDSKYEEQDYEEYRHRYNDYKYYYDSKFNLNIGTIFFTAQKDYGLIEASPVNLELKDRITLTVYSISDLKIKMINVFNIHPDNVKDFDIPANYFLWSPKNRASANVYEIFPFGRGGANFIKVSFDLGFNVGKSIEYESPLKLRERFVSSLDGIFTVGIKYRTFLAELFVENNTKPKIWQVGFSFGLKI
jgi:hypothetical protein